MVLHTRGSIWRKARAGSTALIILPYLWLCRKTHMKIRYNLFQFVPTMQGSPFPCMVMEWCKVDLKHLRSGAQDFLNFLKSENVHGFWVYDILIYFIYCSDFVWYSIVSFCLLMHVDVDINIQLHCRVPSTMACTRHVPEIPLKKPLEILKFSYEIANSQGSCLGQ